MIKDIYKKDAKDTELAEIAEKLKKLRKDKGYSSAETFSYENSLNRVSYYRIENGQNFTMKSLLRILKIYNMSLKDFFSE